MPRLRIREEQVPAIWQMLQTGRPNDFVIVTGEAHSVRVDERLLRPVDVNFLLGGALKRGCLGWKSETGIKKLEERMVNADLDRWTRRLKGGILLWDAPNYPDDLGIISRARQRP